MDSNTLSVIGIFLTLFGLLGSLFAIHLANWFRELLALEQKYEQNKSKDTDEKKSAVRECRYKLRELYNGVTWVVTVLLTAFFLFTFYRGTRLVEPSWSKDPLAKEIGYVGIAFLAIYLALTFFFLIKGYCVGSRLNKELLT